MAKQTKNSKIKSEEKSVKATSNTKDVPSEDPSVERPKKTSSVQLSW